MTEQKPRFTYDYVNCHLLVEMPSHVHEIPCTVFKAWFDRFLDSLDFDHTLMNANVFMNAEVKTEELSTIPDMAMSLIIGNPRRPLKEVLPVLIESGFSQDTNLLIMKLRKQILAKPEVLMVIVALIGETKPYHSPEHSSEAWNTLLKETPPRSFNSFLELQPVDLESTDPITIAGLLFNPRVSGPRLRAQRSKIIIQTWLGFQTVEIWVWVRGDSPINVNLVTGACTAHGRLYPDPHMDAVNAMINKGLRLVKDRLGSLCKEASPTYDIMTLQESPIIFPLAWDHIWNSLVAASGVTAHSRYLKWYGESIRGVKRMARPDSPTNEPSSSNSCSRTQPNVEVSNSSAQPGASNAQQDGKSKSKHMTKQRTDEGKGKGKSIIRCTDA
ncbi:hypothetical protein BDR07DRAFT_1526225 [Suillus spraguei]|nr:hypothetical protein BDR07DRAFT_1526225 [Suillus spraguei]